jgi:hypothetical protein
MGRTISPEDPQPLSAHALVATTLPESFGGGQWARGVMDGTPPTEFWLRREGTQFVVLEGGQRYRPLDAAWIATTAMGLGAGLFVSPCVYRGYPATTAPTLDGQAVLTRFPIKISKVGGHDRRSPGEADLAYSRALQTQPTILVDQGDAIVAVHVLDEPISVEWMSIAARGLWMCSAATPWEQTQYTDPRVSDPLANLVAAIKESMLVALPGQPHPTLVPRFEIKAARVGGLVSWVEMRAKYNLDAIADNLTERKAAGRRMLAQAMGPR